jgi:hypothetical protein
VADATVYLVPSAGAEPDFAREAVTDAEGRFAAAGLGPGPWDVSVLPPGTREGADPGGRFLRGSLERRIPGGVVLDVVPAATLAGRVLYEDGTASRGEGRVSIRSDREPVFRDLRVQPDGTFRAEGLDPTRTWDIVAEEFDGGRSAILMAMPVPVETLEVRVSTRYDLRCCSPTARPRPRESACARWSRRGRGATRDAPARRSRTTPGGS